MEVMIRHRLSYYLLSIENDRSCIIDYEGGKWYNQEYEIKIINNYF